MMIKCCKGCEERTVEPNCHMTCERYLEAVEEADRIREERRKDFYLAAYANEQKARRRG